VGAFGGQEATEEHDGQGEVNEVSKGDRILDTNVDGAARAPSLSVVHGM